MRVSGAATAGLPAITPANLGYGAWVGLVEMGVAFLLWQRALALTAVAGRLGQLIFLSPFLSLVLIATVLGERIHPSAPVALAMIVAGLALSRRRSARKSCWRCRGTWCRTKRKMAAARSAATG